MDLRHLPHHLAPSGSCQACGQASTCLHDDGAFCAEHCPYEQAVRAERRAAREG